MALIACPVHSYGVRVAVRWTGSESFSILDLMKKRRLPSASDFPPGTRFVIKEFDVPLVCVPGEGWLNWFGGSPRPYDINMLRVDNNWPADSFEEWVGVVEQSMSRRRGWFS